MKLNNIQKEFIISAINLKEWVYDFSLKDNEFKDLYGHSKNKILKELKILIEELRR